MFEIGDILRWFYGHTFGKPMNFSFIDEHVSGSAKPLQKKELDWMKSKGITAILSLTEDPLPADWVKSFDSLNVSMKNHAMPEQDQLRKCVDFLISESSNGKKIDVHCAAGSGRTGTVLAAYLCARYDIEANQAIFRVREKRPHSIEKRQEEAVRIFASESKQRESTS